MNSQTNNFKVALCDTDSIFFQKEDGSDFTDTEINSLNSSLNNLFPDGIKWEVNGLFEKAAIIKAKNYVLQENGKLKIKGSALRSPHKEPKFQKFIQEFIQLLINNETDKLELLYNSYVKDILYLTDITDYCSKKTITEAVLNPERSNEQKVFDAIQGQELVQEGDKIFVYFAYDGSLKLREQWNNDHDVYKLLKKLYAVTEIFDTVVKINFTDYTLQKNQQALFDMILNDPTTIPSKDLVYRAFGYFKPKECKCIIIGQDPYPNREDACGLAFSVDRDKNLPKSLINVFKELSNDLGHPIPQTGNLEPWAKQGVLLVNTVLTTKEGQSNAHRNMGWEQYTTDKINSFLRFKQPVVIIAWGKQAQDKVKELKLNDNCLVLTSVHPSPLSAYNGFFGGKYFSKCNEWLESKGSSPIDWKL